MNPLKHYRIFDEEPCPCGSGMKYSLCCKKREDSFQRDNKRPVEVQAAETLKKSQYKCCLHPDKSRCVKHIKEAHALQNNKIISLLSENGHVYMLNDKKPPLIIPTEKGEIETLTLYQIKSALIVQPRQPVFAIYTMMKSLQPQKKVRQPLIKAMMSISFCMRIRLLFLNITRNWQSKKLSNE